MPGCFLASWLGVGFEEAGAAHSQFFLPLTHAWLPGCLAAWLRCGVQISKKQVLARKEVDDVLGGRTPGRTWTARKVGTPWHGMACVTLRDIRVPVASGDSCQLSEELPLLPYLCTRPHCEVLPISSLLLRMT